MVWEGLRFVVVALPGLFSYPFSLYNFVLEFFFFFFFFFFLFLFQFFGIVVTSLGEERPNLSAFRTFVRFALVWFCLFPLPLGVLERLRLVIVALPGLFLLHFMCICLVNSSVVYLKCVMMYMIVILPLLLAVFVDCNVFFGNFYFSFLSMAYMPFVMWRITLISLRWWIFRHLTRGRRLYFLQKYRSTLKRKKSISFGTFYPGLVILFVRLSLLTMTIPNQLCDVLLFVCSKMADEPNLSSKLPVADRTREVWGRKLCWWCLSSGFPLCTFLFGFADSFRFVFTSSPFYEASPLCTILCNLLWVYLFGMLKSLREALRVSLYCFFWPPWERFPTWSSP